MTEGIRGKWRYDPLEGKLVPTCEESTPYSAHYVQQDSMDATWHPATGQYFESKSAFRKTTKERGFVEIDDNRAWGMIGTRGAPEIEGLREDVAEVRHWYEAAARGNKDYINANVPPELRDCEAVDPNDITEGIRR